MKRNRIRRVIKKAKYITLGLSMAALMYTAMIANTATSKERKEWI